MPSVTSETFRGLVERIAHEGMPVDRKRTIMDLVKLCKVSRPAFYQVLTGRRRLTDDLCARLTKGLQRAAPWVTRERVLAAAEASLRAAMVRELED